MENQLCKWNEKEWKELQVCRFFSQKTALQNVRKQLQDMHEKFNKLKEDFVYNLRILDERDKELECYDVVVTHLKASENAKKAEISDLRIQLDKLEQTIVKESKKREELYRYQQDLKDHKLELEWSCRYKNSKMGHQCEDYASVKHVTEKNLQEVEGELACQKQNDSSDERVYLHLGVLTRIWFLVIAYESTLGSIKLLTGEPEILKETGVKAAESLQKAETINLKLEEEIKFKDCEFKDFVAVKDARHEVLDCTAKEKAAMPASVTEAQIEQLQNLETQIRELQMRHRSLEMGLHRRERSCCACLSEKDALIEKYKQLALPVEGEQILQHSKAQEELDWQQRCENTERNHYQKSEDLIQSPSSASVQMFQCADKSSLNKDFPTMEVKKLKKQNDSLRTTIAQMRKEMESLNEQMLPSCPQTENRRLAEQTNTDITTEISAGSSGHEVEWDEGSSYRDKVSTITTLNNIKMSSTNLNSIVKPHKEKEPKPKVLKERMADNLQQLSVAGLSDGIPYGMGCSLLGIQNKLKKAVRKILILSQEKQQLIEMGNKLRAELGMVSKEGLRLPDQSKCCMVCVASGSLFPRELVKRAQCQLSALKNLQYKLATQVQLDSCIENCGAAQQKTCTSSALVESQPLGESPSQAQQVWHSSSITHSCCQDTCHALETRSNPSILSPQNNSGQGVEFQVIYTTKVPEEFQQNIKDKDKVEIPAAHLTVTGAKLEVQQKVKSRNWSCVHPIKPKISSKVVKIRNYNIKD
ncbi:coiled-coil domain-containing protein 57 [Eudromia elegans]